MKEGHLSHFSARALRTVPRFAKTWQRDQKMHRTSYSFQRMIGKNKPALIVWLVWNINTTQNGTHHHGSIRNGAGSYFNQHRQSPFGHPSTLWLGHPSALRPLIFLRRPGRWSKEYTFVSLYEMVVNIHYTNIEWWSYPYKKLTFQQSFKVICFVIGKIFKEAKWPVSGEQFIFTRL
jgi:hypothetical protein